MEALRVLAEVERLVWLHLLGPYRIIIAAVRADITVRAAHRSGFDMAAVLVRQALTDRHHTPHDNAVRSVLGGMLCAVADLHRTSCRHARERLHKLIPAPAAPAARTAPALAHVRHQLAPALARGVAELDRACATPAHRGTARRVPPLPGGILRPDLIVSVDVAAARIAQAARADTAVHRCRTPGKPRTLTTHH